VSWSAVATLVLLAVGLHIVQKLKKVWVAYTLDAPSREIYTCSHSICKCQTAHQILTSILISFEIWKGSQNKNWGLQISPDAT